jgi:hypothetical protein
MAGQGEPSLLDLMDGIAGGDGIEFEPPRLTMQSRAASFE